MSGRLDLHSGPCRRRGALLALALALLVSPQAAAQAQPKAPQAPPAAAPAPAPEAPYDERLMRLSEILGSVAYLRGLCGAPDKDGWRSAAQALIEREAGAEEARKARFTAAFNRGFRSFAAVYIACTPSAVLADERYRAEGATLASEIVARFGN